MKYGRPGLHAVTKMNFYSGPTLDCLLYSVSSITRYCIGNLFMLGDGQ